MSETDLLASIDAVTSAIRTRRTSALEVVELALARIEADQPVTNAFITVTADSARHDAARVDAALRRGEPLGRLAGVPLAVKDVFDVEGQPTTGGSLLLRDSVADKDSAAVSALRGAGAVVVGKTNMDEFAFGPNQRSFGRTNLPQDPTRYSGGSSAGSAVAVAECCAPVAIGTDAGGSVRYPAACCGVVGFKPTFGRLNLTGAFPSFQTLDHLGLMARKVHDVMVLGNVLDPMPGHLPPVRPPMRLGVPRGWEHRCEQPVVDAFARVLESLRAQGAVLEPVELPDEDGTFTVLLSTVSVEAAEALAEVIGLSRRADISDSVRLILAAGRAVTGTDYVAAQRLRSMWRSCVDRLLGDVDAIVTPTISRPALAWDDPDLHDWKIARFLPLFNLTGHPAISIPAPTGGLPVGVQLVGRRHEDAELLATALWVEERMA